MNHENVGGIPPKQSFNVADIEIGKTASIGINRLVNFKITTAGGTIIEGVIPLNEYLTITNGGDLTDVKLMLFDQPKGPVLADLAEGYCDSE